MAEPADLDLLIHVKGDVGGAEESVAGLGHNLGQLNAGDWAEGACKGSGRCCGAQRLGQAKGELTVAPGHDLDACAHVGPAGELGVGVHHVADVAFRIRVAALWETV